MAGRGSVLPGRNQHLLPHFPLLLLRTRTRTHTRRQFLDVINMRARARASDIIKHRSISGMHGLQSYQCLLLLLLDGLALCCCYMGASITATSTRVQRPKQPQLQAHAMRALRNVVH